VRIEELNKSFLFKFREEVEDLEQFSGVVGQIGVLVVPYYPHEQTKVDFGLPELSDLPLFVFKLYARRVRLQRQFQFFFGLVYHLNEVFYGLEIPFLQHFVDLVFILCHLAVELLAIHLFLQSFARLLVVTQSFLDVFEDELS